MAVITISHHPELTAEDLVAIFQRHLGDKYEIIRVPEGIRRKLWRDFVVKRNAWVGVAVRLKQEPNKTLLMFDGVPSYVWAWCVMLVVGVLTVPLSVLFLLIWLFAVLKGPTDEVRHLIETAEEFR